MDLLVDDIELTLAPYSVRDVTSDYIVRWYRGTEVLAANLISGQTSRVVSTLPDGTYTAEARLTGGNNCPLVAANTVTIGQTTEDINVQVREVSPVTSCTTSNGSLSAGVSVSGMVTTMGYTFTWYETSELATPVATGSDATGLSAVSYTVRVTDNSTGCVTSVARAVTSSLTSPTIQIEEENDIRSCVVGAMGSARVSSGGATTGFTFEWFRGRLPVAPSVLPGSPDFTGSLVTNLAAGYYVVRAVQDGSSCSSSALELQIESDLGDVVVSTSELLGSSNCAVPFNGLVAAQASYDGGAVGTSGFVFDFFEGANTLSANEVTNRSMLGTDPYIGGDTVLLRLPFGQYTVRATHITSSCVGEATFSVASVTPTLPTIDLTSINATNNTICSGVGTPTGSIDASGAVTTGGRASDAGYRYSLTAVTSPPSSSVENTTGIFSNLGTGDYVFRVTDLGSSCRSANNTLRILQSPNLTGIMVDSQLPDTACVASAAGGEVSYTAQLAPGATISMYTHEIYRGANRMAANRVSSMRTGSASHTFTGLEDGVYRIVVISDNSGCSRELDITIADSPFVPTYASVAADVTANSSCRSENGAITVNLVDSQGRAIGDPSSVGYLFTWYRGSTSSPPSVQLPGSTQTQTGLETGTHAVTITGPNGCSTSGVSTFNVPDSRVVVGVDIVVSSSLTSCQQSDANGSLEAEITSGGAASDFTFEWYEEALTSAPITAGTAGTGFATSQQIDNRWEAQYAVRATHTSSGCTSEDTDVLRSTRESPQVSLTATPTSNTACVSPFNGSASIRVQYEGSVVTDFTGFSFSLNGSSIAASASLTGLAANATPGHMLVVSRRGCDGSLSIVLGDNISLPDLSTNTVTDSRSCDEDRAPSGAISVQPDGSTTGTGYTFSWYNEPYTLTSPAIGGEVSNSLLRRRSGRYSVRVVNDATGCVSTRDFTINLTPGTAPSATFSVSDITDCDPFNGSIQVNLAGGADVADYEWSWFVGLDDSSPLVEGGSVVLSSGQAQGLGPGLYSVRWAERSTACVSMLFTRRVVVSSTRRPIFDGLNPTPAGDCRGAQGTGRVSIRGPLSLRFDVRLYTGSPSDFTGVTPVAMSSDVGVGSQDFMLVARTYTVRVTERMSQCDSISSLTIDYINSPTVISVTNIQPSNCASYTNADGDGGQGGASGSVQVRLEVDNSSGIDHDSYQIFLYASSGLSSAARFEPSPVMTMGSMEWRVSDGRPRVIQGVSASETGAASGRVATSTLSAVTG